MTTSTQSEIHLSSGRTGAGPATWGQRAIWDAVSVLGPADAPRYNITAASPPDPAVPVPVVLQALRQLLELHDGLHTRLRPDGAGGLEQVVDATGRLTVEVRRCGPDEAEVAEVGRALHAELAALPFDCTEEWPIRVGFVEVDGMVRHFTLVLSHTAVDGFGMRQLVMNLTELVQGVPAREIARRRPSFQPLEEAAFQVSERGRRRDARARQHWRRKLRAAPPQLFSRAASGSEEELRFPNAVLNSPALARAVPHVAAAHRLSPSSVLVGAAATMTARLSGGAEAVFQVVVNNRFLPGLRHAVSVVAGDGIVHLTDLDAGSAAFGDVLRRAHATSLAAYSHAYFDKRQLEADLRELGEQVPLADRSCIVNDTLDLVPAQAPAQPVPHEPLARALGRSSLAWPVEFEPRAGLSFALDAAHTPAGLDLAMTADPRALPRADMERLLLGMEELVVTEALALGCE